MLEDPGERWGEGRSPTGGSFLHRNAAAIYFWGPERAAPRTLGVQVLVVWLVGDTAGRVCSMLVSILLSCLSAHVKFTRARRESSLFITGPPDLAQGSHIAPLL